MKNLILFLLVIFAVFASACTTKQVKTHVNNQTFRGEKMPEKLELLSPVFTNGTSIPEKYTCKGEDINPPLEIKNIPEGTKSLALIMDDPDAPMGTWDHWLVYDMPLLNKINENSVPGIQGRNSWGRNDYGGPCPPDGEHRYFFKLYALDEKLNLKEGATKQELLNAMESHIISQTELVGMFKK